MKSSYLYLSLLIFILSLSANIQAQIVHLTYPKNTIQKTDNPIEATQSKKEDAQLENTVEWFKGGNIDFISGGLLQTTAKLMKINIGEPDSFYLPFYFLIGSTADVSADEDAQNENTSINLLSPNGGYLNLGIHGTAKLKKFNEHTRLSLSYQLGAKTINGEINDSTSNVQLLSGIGNLGLLFQTAAWNPENIENIGMAWLQVSLASTLNDKDKLQLVYGDEDIDRLFYGLNIEAGVEIEKYIHLRLGYYKYFNNQEFADEFDKGIFKLSADFNLNN